MPRFFSVLPVLSLISATEDIPQIDRRKPEPMGTAVIPPCEGNTRRVGGALGCYAMPEFEAEVPVCSISQTIQKINDTFCESRGLLSETAYEDIQTGVLMGCSDELTNLLEVIDRKIKSCSPHMLRSALKLLSQLLAETSDFSVAETQLLTAKIQEITIKLVPLIEGLDASLYRESIDLVLQTAKKFPNEDTITVPVLRTMIAIAINNAFYDISQKSEVRRFAKRYAKDFKGASNQKFGADLLEHLSPTGWIARPLFNFLDNANDDLNIMIERLPTFQQFQFFLIRGFIPPAVLLPVLAYVYNKFLSKEDEAIPRQNPATIAAKFCGIFAGTAVVATIAISAAATYQPASNSGI